VVVVSNKVALDFGCEYGLLSKDVLDFVSGLKYGTLPLESDSGEIDGAKLLLI
jgi:hypothetical protein